MRFRHTKWLNYVFSFMIFSAMIAALVAAPPAPAAAAQSANCAFFHVIQPGENLFRISLRFGVSIQAIAAANGIADVTRVFAGDTLCIPAGSTTTTVTTTDTQVDPRANICFPGGQWEGLCNHPYFPPLHEWFWTCGWYRAHNIELADCRR